MVELYFQNGQNLEKCSEVLADLFSILYFVFFKSVWSILLVNEFMEIRLAFQLVMAVDSQHFRLET